jgi:hypothetical protein
MRATNSQSHSIYKEGQIRGHRNRAKSLRVFIDPRVTERVAFQCVTGPSLPVDTTPGRDLPFLREMKQEDLVSRSLQRLLTVRDFCDVSGG